MSLDISALEKLMFGYDAWKTTPPNNEREEKITDWAWDLTDAEVLKECEKRQIDLSQEFEKIRETLIDAVLHDE